MGSIDRVIVTFLLYLYAVPRLLASPTGLQLTAAHTMQANVSIPRRRELPRPLLLRCQLSAGVPDQPAAAGVADQPACSKAQHCPGSSCLSLLESGQLQLVVGDQPITTSSAAAENLLLCDGTHLAVFETTILQLGDDPDRAFAAKVVSIRQLSKEGYQDIRSECQIGSHPTFYKHVASSIEQCILSSLYATAGILKSNNSEHRCPAEEWRLLRVRVLLSDDLSSCLAAVTDVSGTEPDSQALLRQAQQVVTPTTALETAARRQELMDTLLKHGFDVSEACPAGGHSCLTPAEVTCLVTSVSQTSRAGHLVRLRRQHTINRVFGPELPLTLSKGAYSAAERAGLLLLDSSMASAEASMADMIFSQLATPLKTDSNETSCSNDPAHVTRLASLLLAPGDLQLEPTFSPEVEAYQVKIAPGRLQVTITAKALHCAAEILIMGTQRNTVSVSTPVGVRDSSVQLRVMPPGMSEHHARTYRITFHREPPGTSIDAVNDRYEMCLLRQKCALPFVPGGCGPTRLSTRDRDSEGGSMAPVLPLCPTAEGQSGHWVMPCLSCEAEQSCDWSRAEWSAVSCRYRSWTRDTLQEAAADAQLLVLGDSTLRSVLYRAVERLNGTLSRADNVHGLIQLRAGPGGRTQVTYSYYPRFFLPKDSRPSFRQLLVQLIDRSRPVSNSRRTRLMVGGVQWLGLSHLNTLQEVLQDQGLQAVTVIVKGHGAGFYLPGSSASVKARYSQLYRQNQALRQATERRHWIFIDTLPMTLSRYDEFTQGVCACHFHTVQRLSPSSYTIHGPINEAYTNIFLHHLFGGE